MRIPKIHGSIDRRILINYRLDADLVAPRLPRPFRPLLVRGCAIGGVCLIRFHGLRPRGVPPLLGMTSENAAHRFAVEWDDAGRVRSGVFISHRATSSRLVTWAGGRIFPGVHELAHFSTLERDGTFAIGVRGGRGGHDVAIVAHESRLAAREFANGDASVFSSLDEASRFFELGSLGFSSARGRDRFEGLELSCSTWSMRPLRVDSIRSAFFDDRQSFPAGTATLDSVLLMERTPHEWRAGSCFSATRPSRAVEGRFVAREGEIAG